MEVQGRTTRRRTSARSPIPNNTDILQSDEKYNDTSSQDAPVKRWSEDEKIMPLKKRKIPKTICEEDEKEDKKFAMKKCKSYLVDQCDEETNKETRSSVELPFGEEVPEVDTETKLKQTPTYNSSGHEGNGDDFSVDQIIDDVLLSIQRDFNSNPQNKFKEEETQNDIKIEEKPSSAGVVSGLSARIWQSTEESSPFIKEEEKLLVKNYELEDDTGFMIQTSPTTLGTNADQERFFEEVKEDLLDEVMKLGGITMDELFEAEEDFGVVDRKKAISGDHQIQPTAFNQQCCEVPINDDAILKVNEEEPILILDSEEEEVLEGLRNIPKRKRSNRRRRNPKFVSRCLSAYLDNEHEGLLEKTRQFDIDLYSRVKKGCRGTAKSSQNHSKCNQVSRRGWRCNNNVKKPFSLCAYHLEKQETLERRREEKIKCNHSEKETAGPKSAEKCEMQTPLKLQKTRSIQFLLENTVPTPSLYRR